MFKHVSRLHKRLVAVAIFMTLFLNLAFFKTLLKTYPGMSQVGFVLSVAVFFTALHVLLLAVFAHGRLARWWLAFVLLAGASSAYFMDHYGTVIDTSMLENLTQTNVSEASDLFNLRMLGYLLLGLLPAVWVVRSLTPPLPWKGHFKSLAVMLASVVLAVLLAVAPFSSQYASFLREHKSIRYYANPGYPVTSLLKFVAQTVDSGAPAIRAAIAPDAKIVEEADHKELVILVVGETARADHFSLNGYARNTNPELSKLDVLSFSDVTSCGTSTAVSVPCMFSGLGADQYSSKEGQKHTNLLDTLKAAGVQVLWRDNNSDSKGVALRVDYEDFKTPATNKQCDEECRDVGMLDGLEDYVKRHADKDILIVLHQMGNHGPAYYKRYPQAFERFKPVCETNELSNCSNEQIINAYDNAILYTDHFLAQVIGFLKRHDHSHETAMLYVSDHGESLGEFGMYLHGAPKAIAPRAQVHVPAIVWTGQHFQFPRDELKRYKDVPLSHDDLFCVMSMAFEMKSTKCEQYFKTR
ncbi:MAG TPA: phosphoethanolamine--lipid A transferase [Limnobacter sp.]|uniref:phosphoethanolamine transferase n=1 Tax=Limnobacter sp. TaxID=2003368 RepID=UPI002EDBACAB